MKISKTSLISLAIIAASFVVGWYYYPFLPERLASHWDSAGQINGYMPKFWGVFLVPGISLALYGLFMVVTRIDPKKENIQKFRKYFDGFILCLFLFLFYVYCLTLAWNLGHEINLIQYMSPAFAVLFGFIGYMLTKTELNWSIGIRTPWTLSSDVVWKKTHKLGAWLFGISGFISLGGLFFPLYAFWFVLVPVLSSAAISVIYSYLVFRAEKSK